MVHAGLVLLLNTCLFVFQKHLQIFFLHFMFTFCKKMEREKKKKWFKNEILHVHLIVFVCLSGKDWPDSF